MSIKEVSRLSIILGAEMYKKGADDFDVFSGMHKYFKQHGIQLLQFRDGGEMLHYCQSLAKEVRDGKRDYKLCKIA